MSGDQWFKQEQQKKIRKERQRARRVLLYLEERYKQVDEKISGFDSFPEEIKVADRFWHILMQKRNEDEVMVKAQRGNREGVVTQDTGWVVMQVGSAATIVRSSSRLHV